jgi:salicylate hydroxylase
VAKNTRILQEWLHLYDGPERDRRDELMRHNTKDNPIYWAYNKRKDWLFGHDAQKLQSEAENLLPELAGLPAEGARIYDGNLPDTELRKQLRNKQVENIASHI